MRSLLRVLTLLLPLAVSGGCTSVKEYIQNGFEVGPDYRRPTAATADDWIDSKNPHIQVGAADNRNWWTVFRDPALDYLVLTAYQQNLTLREAGYRVAEARARRNVAAGNLFPQSQDVFGNYTRSQLSEQTATFTQFPSSAFPAGIGRLTNYSNFQLGGSLAWEVDFWGRFRRSVEAADARLDASVENYDDALVLLIAEVASTYVEMRTAEQRLQVARSNATLQEESARVANARLNAQAIDSEVDAPQANSNLARTRAAIELFKIQRRQAQNRLCVLMGMPPQDLLALLGESAVIPQAPETVVVDLPASLLWRRPDVRRAERLAAAESAEIGVAVSNLYPHISVNGTMQLEAAQFGNLFNGNAFAGTIGPAFRWDVLNYGRLINNIDLEDAQFRAQATTFQQTLLEANEEAENAIVAIRFYHAQIDQLERSVSQAQEAVRVTQAKYAAGDIDFNRVFTVEQLLTQQQDLLATARGNLAQSSIDLYRAVGGGWEIRLDPEAKIPRAPGFVPPTLEEPTLDLPEQIPAPQDDQEQP
ncbi:efflux transporter outer membrane subunit [Lignipirellula cremea]|uniref:Putative efflux pump outer membrane protein TtgC n=1 Tax=Lignipirellula cremea TaxID=2528010 RepID=A0A518DXX1_9BACT|nr:efflux transporter outer membrane subunit [Lignipirellula cremea]QDU96684.1 putative efflux pump outer membrane protein TtgC precursor [Lignipirellula cremea]